MNTDRLDELVTEIRGKFSQNRKGGKATAQISTELELSGESILYLEEELSGEWDDVRVESVPATFGSSNTYIITAKNLL